MVSACETIVPSLVFHRIKNLYNHRETYRSHKNACLGLLVRTKGCSWHLAPHTPLRRSDCIYHIRRALQKRRMLRKGAQQLAGRLVASAEPLVASSSQQLAG